MRRLGSNSLVAYRQAMACLSWSGVIGIGKLERRWGQAPFWGPSNLLPDVQSLSR